MSSKPDKPKRPLTAYTMWQNSVRDQYKSENPAIRERSRSVSTWTAKEKSEWEEKAAKAMKQYEKDLALYDAANDGAKEVKHQSNENKSNFDAFTNFMKSDKPRRPMKPYMMWLNSAREQFKTENPGIKVTEGAKRMTAIWSAMDHTEWEEKHAKAMEQYEKDMVLYEAAKEGNIK